MSFSCFMVKSCFQSTCQRLKWPSWAIQWYSPFPCRHFLHGGRSLRIVDQYTYLGIVMHKGGHVKAVIDKLAAASKHALFALQSRCSELGLYDIHLRCSLFSSLVQPILSYGCWIWGLEKPYLFSQMNTIHHHFMKRTLHLRKSVPDAIMLCELGRVPLQLYWQKLILKYVCRLSDLPANRLVRKAFTHAFSLTTPGGSTFPFSEANIILKVYWMRCFLNSKRRAKFTGHMV